MVNSKNYINMKRYLLLVFGLFICILLHSQNTIVNSNSSWATLTYGTWGAPHCIVTEFTYFEQDTLIDAISYKKVFSCNDKLHENIKYEGLIREQDKKTYFIPLNYTTEFLLYDFSLKEGMDFDFQYKFYHKLLHVKKIDSIEINGVLKKQIQLTLPNNTNVHVTWIENIGSLAGFFYSGGNLDTCNCEYTLLCHFQDDESIYKNPIYSECYYDNGEELSVQTTEIDNISVFPNPVDDRLTIFSQNNTILRIEFFDIFGKRVYSETYQNNIDVSCFPRGVYILKVYDTNEYVSVYKIVKR